MSQFKIPTASEVNEQNQAIFNKLESNLGFVPNLYAFLANHDNALGALLSAGDRKLTISKKEAEVVNLVVSEYNYCKYCLSAHTAIAGMNGFTPDQILEIRDASITFDDKLAVLATFTKAVVSNKGKVSDASKREFFDAGYSVQNLIDVVFTISEITTTNLIHNLTDFEIDFPLAKRLDGELVA